MSVGREFFRGFRHGFKSFGELIATIVNCALLAVAYILGVGLTALAARIMRKRFLATKLEPKRKSYWEDLGLASGSDERHYRQF